MLAASLIVKKREGLSLTDDEIRWFIDGFCDGSVADYQMSAMAMAICLRGMDARETATLTTAMLESGDRMQRIGDRPRVDKHSTGGLGDKVSLVLAPMLAACGVDVPMISGRGLGLTGGTLDKLEAVEGFSTQLSTDECDRILREVGLFIVGANDRIAPADRRLYALRDVTGTVESVALITASILSKKLAANLDALVMDVKVGDAAFMTTLERAQQLAESLVRVGRQSGLPTTAILSDMDQPLGRAIGNANEVNEAVDVLQGGGPTDVLELSIELGVDLLLQAKIAATDEVAREKLANSISSGDAYDRFLRMVAAQGGKPTFPLPVQSPHVIPAKQSGYLAKIDCVAIGESVVSMGGGRRRVGDAIDPAVGVLMHGRIGDPVEKGEPILSLHCHTHRVSDYLKILTSAVEISDQPVSTRSLVVKRLRA